MDLGEIALCILGHMFYNQLLTILQISVLTWTNIPGVCVF